MNILKNSKVKLFGVLAVIAFIMIGYSLANESKDYKLLINGKEASGDWIDYDSREQLYVSANALGELGYKVDVNEWETSATISKKSEVVELSSASYMAEINGKEVSLHTKSINGVHVPSGATTYSIDGEFMIPLESVEQLFGYEVTTKEKNGLVTAYIGKVVDPKPEKPSKPSNPSNIEENPKYPFPEGYVPQEITGKWSNDKAANLKAIADGLGSEYAKYIPEDHSTAFSSYKRPSFSNSEILVMSHDVDNLIPYDALILINAWGNEHNEINNSVPYALKEILRFYLGEKDGDWAYQVIEDGFTNGTDVKFREQIKVGNRYIEFRANPNEIYIGKPNEKYNESWSQVVR